MNKNARSSWLALLVLAFASASTAFAVPAAKQRLIVLSDIEADPDDTQSFVRLLLYSNEIDIEGMVATTSTHMRGEVHPESIRRIIEAYGAARVNLLLHARGWPAARDLLARVTQGLPLYGMSGVGEGKDSPGSAAILRALNDPDPRPLWITVWGGANTLAQALFRMKADHPDAELRQLVGKLRVHTISDQDDSGAWIRENFPDLFYIVSPGGYGHGVWGAIHQVVDGIDNRTVSNAWLAENIQQGHGPLGAIYPDVAYGMEGDTPSFLGLIPNGLNAPEHPDWGGWGGRYELYLPRREDLEPTGFTGGVPVGAETRPIWTNASDNFAPAQKSDYGRAIHPAMQTFSGSRVTLWRWRDDFQNDFAARMAWATANFAHANHPPVVVASAEQPSVRSGDSIWLSAIGSSDPDGDSLSFRWFHYPEPGGWSAPIAPASAENLRRVRFVAPAVTKPQIAHFIVAVTDKGRPALTRYQRVIVTINPM